MEKESFERMYLEMAPGLYRLAQSILHHPPDAQDALQQAAVNAWRSLARIHPGTERAYFTRILINECRNIQRRRMRMLPMDPLPERPARNMADSSLKEAIHSLPEGLRLPFLLHFMEGYTDREGADAMGLSLSAFKTRLIRARKKLQKILEEEGMP
ncbi:MAG: RNA polymerase sigma factor [Clostridia bacterium]|nr:RNA polymerase sigma factor [Clostridia bacterium]